MCVCVGATPACHNTVRPLVLHEGEQAEEEHLAEREHLSLGGRHQQCTKQINLWQIVCKCAESPKPGAPCCLIAPQPTINLTQGANNKSYFSPGGKEKSFVSPPPSASVLAPQIFLAKNAPDLPQLLKRKRSISLFSLYLHSKEAGRKMTCEKKLLFSVCVSAGNKQGVALLLCCSVALLLCCSAALLLCLFFELRRFL